VKSDDSIWFTDPPYGILSDYEGNKAEPESGNNVYPRRRQDRRDQVRGRRFHPAERARLLADEKKLYIVDSAGGRTKGQPKHIRVFDVGDGGKLSGGNEFADCTAGASTACASTPKGGCGPRPTTACIASHRRHADRQGQDSGDLRQRRVRRAEAQHALHLRDQLALRVLTHVNGLRTF
jgi:hypothetical protein